MDEDGAFVVVWDNRQTEKGVGIGTDVKGQRFSSDGTAVGSSFRVNSYTPDYQFGQKIDMTPDGRFVVVWITSRGGPIPPLRYNIQGQRFVADGSAIGDEFHINTYNMQGGLHPSLGIGHAGEFVVAWNSQYDDKDSSSYSVRAKRYGSDGSILSGPFLVNTYTTGIQAHSSVALNSAGDFVFVWHSEGSFGNDISGSSIQAQRYHSDGSVMGGEYQVNTYTTGFQRRPSVAMDADGGFVVVWQNQRTHNDVSLLGQRFSSAGWPLSGEFQINSYTANSGSSPKVAIGSTGAFVVVWQSEGSSHGDTEGGSILGQSFEADGSKRGSEFQVNTYTSNNQDGPVVAVGENGRFVVVWNSYGSDNGDTHYGSVQGQRFRSGIFCDGFEAGDTSAWFSGLSLAVL